MEVPTLCNLSFSLAGGRAAKANAGVGNELHSLEQATLFFELLSTKYSNPGHLDNNLLKKRMILFIMKQELGVIWGKLWDLNDVLLLRLEEELNSPHVVSLVTDYNVMPVGKIFLFWIHQRFLNSLSLTSVGLKTLGVNNISFELFVWKERTYFGATWLLTSMIEMFRRISMRMTIRCPYNYKCMTTHCKSY